jgi:hypothetical protein
MIIHPLSEGQFTVDQTKVFVPFDASQHQLTARPAGSLLVEIQPFVVITSQDVILLDAGLLCWSRVTAASPVEFCRSTARAGHKSDPLAFA